MPSTGAELPEELYQRLLRYKIFSNRSIRAILTEAIHEYLIKVTQNHSPKTKALLIGTGAKKRQWQQRTTKGGATR